MKKKRHLYLNLIGYLLIIGLIVLAVRKLPLEDAVTTIQEHGWGDIVTTFFLFSLAMGLRTYRFTLIAPLSSKTARIRTAIVFPWLFMISALGPFRLGEGAKIIWLFRDRQPPMTALGTLAAERVIDLCSLLMIGAAGLLLHPGIMQTRTLALVSLFILLVLGCFLGLYALLRRPEKLNWLLKKFNREQLQEPLLKKTGQLTDGFRIMLQSGRLPLVIGISLLTWACMAGGFHVFLQGFLGTISLGISSAMVVAVNFAAILSFIPGNIGSFQLVATPILTLAGNSLEVALMSTLLLQATSITTVIILGTLSRIGLLIWDRSCPPKKENQPEPADS